MKAKQSKKYMMPFIMIMVVLLAFSSPSTANYAGDHPMTVYEYEEIEGGLVYETVTDGSAYTVLLALPPTGWPTNLTQLITISIPDGAEVKTARLYNYYTWSTSDYGNAYTPGVPAEVELALANVATGETWNRTCIHGYTDAQRDIVPNPIYYHDGEVVHYWDSKSQEYVSKVYDFPSGTFAWDVTNLVTGSGTYIAKIENKDSTPTAGPADRPERWERFATYGFGLLVVYELDEGPEVEYWITEGCDILYNKTGYETAENATTRAVFADPEFEFEKVEIISADMTTVVSASNYWWLTWNMVYFNDVEVGPSTAASDRAIGVNTFDVLNLLSEEQNIAKIQDREDYETAHNAFLVVETEEKENIGG